MERQTVADCLQDPDELELESVAYFNVVVTSVSHENAT